MADVVRTGEYLEAIKRHSVQELPPIPKGVVEEGGDHAGQVALYDHAGNVVYRQPIDAREMLQNGSGSFEPPKKAEPKSAPATYAASVTATKSDSGEGDEGKGRPSGKK